MSETRKGPPAEPRADASAGSFDAGGARPRSVRVPDRGRRPETTPDGPARTEIRDLLGSFSDQTGAAFS